MGPTICWIKIIFWWVFFLNPHLFFPADILFCLLTQFYTTHIPLFEHYFSWSLATSQPKWLYLRKVSSVLSLSLQIKHLFLVFFHFPLNIHNIYYSLDIYIYNKNRMSILPCSTSPPHYKFFIKATEYLFFSILYSYSQHWIDIVIVDIF